MKKVSKRILAAVLTAVMTLSLAACGGADGDGDKGNNKGNNGKGNQSEAKAPEWVYVPEYVELSGDGSYWSAQAVGDYLYYTSYTWDEETQISSQSLCKLSVVDGSVETVPLDLENVNLNSFAIGADGSLYAVSSVWTEDKNQQAIVKFDAQGNLVYNMDVTADLEKEGIDWLNRIATDAEGRLYMTSDSKVLLYDAQGTYTGCVDLGNGGWINLLGQGRDGKVYAGSYSYSSSSNGFSLTEIDFDKKAAGTGYENFPNGNGELLVPGVEKDFLAYDQTGVYEYDMATQTSELLFKWLDSDINAQSVRFISPSSDGKVIVILNDWETNEYNLVKLTKTPGSEVKWKETIVVGTLSSSSELNAAAVKFNKSNDKYRVSVREYIDRTAGWTENTWQDGITAMNNDITSGNCPDIIDLNNLEVQKLVSKGLLEDIGAYLDKSTVLGREDYIQNILNGYTYDGVLVGIPKTFYLQTVAGNPEQVGTKMGWSLDEMIAYANKYPDAKLFDYTDKGAITYYCMMNNESAFIDWNTGKCSFNSPEFISLLEFINRFPDEMEWVNDGLSTPTKIQNGEVLLDTAYLSEFEDVQMCNEIFGGKANFIGYPTTDGSAGCAMYASDIYAITTKSDKKDGAWAFVESYLSDLGSERWSWGFSSNKKELENQVKKATTVETYTWTDENGEEHVETMSGGGSMTYEDGWSFTYHTVTQEEVDQVMALIEVARPVAAQNSQIMSIISEEAEAFYKGQKTAADVADVIQRRAQMYVDENN